MDCDGLQDVFEIRYARMPEDRARLAMEDTGGLSLAANSGLTCDPCDSVASDSGSEAGGPITESVRERRLRQLQLQVLTHPTSKQMIPIYYRY